MIVSVVNGFVSMLRLNRENEICTCFYALGSRVEFVNNLKSSRLYLSRD